MGEAGDASQDETGKLLDYVLLHCESFWDKVPKEAGLNRSPNSCKNMWIEIMSSLVLNALTDKEKSKIVELHMEQRDNWCLIADEVFFLSSFL